MPGFPVFYAKYCHLKHANYNENISQVFEWWIFNDKQIFVQSKLEGVNQSKIENDCCQFEIDNQDHVTLLELIANDFPLVSSNNVNAVSWWEMHVYDANGNVVNWFRGSDISNQVLLNLKNILVKYVPFEQQEQLCDFINMFGNRKEGKHQANIISKNIFVENNIQHQENKLSRILKICCNILVIGLCLDGGLVYGSDLVRRAFMYDDSLMKYTAPIFFLTILPPIFYLLFFNLKSKYRICFGVIAAGLFPARQLFCLLRTPSMSTLACLIAASSFFLIFILTILIKKQHNRISILYMSIIPIVFNIVGVCEIDTGITHDYTFLMVISTIFIVLCHWCLIIRTTTAE